MPAMLISLAVLLAAPNAPLPDELDRHIYSGEIGPYRIGADILVRNHKRVEAASYFYATKGIDIPLKSAVDGENLILSEPGGGTFRLHFVGNGPTKPPLDFYTSVGLAGSWSGNGKQYPVKLDLEFARTRRDDGRWYADITTSSDVEFEAIVRRFLTGVTTGNKDMAASAISFPLRVNGPHGTFTIKNADQLKRRWSQVFTRSYVGSLRSAVPHKMFVRNSLAMVSNGAAWFDGKGAVALNVL